MKILIVLFALSTLVLTASPVFSDTWKRPACSNGTGSLEKRSGKNEWRCKKNTGNSYQYRSKGTTPSHGQCASIAGVGYFWAKRSGKWKCCGVNPLGETCKKFTGKVGPVKVGKCPNGFTKRDTGDGNKVCRKSVKSYSYSNPIWVD